eukprot:CAMPEP_0202878186 /NCGR_PEP_ID=MMETSP1391-20130828/31788_1 /ASSEMBLY_ACC=CAM_ASM_000867 /TAXON_ID=1034604 /ORGANISM="Chlamydomonas leiostraca, Strain SAG 11-49" /LENGTH=70 /DNA_ID=CAMNT_0049560341 /DNA_START=253 /DNA_END=462 /DNA_ORIENTATION=-
MLAAGPAGAGWCVCVRRGAGCVPGWMQMLNALMSTSCDGWYESAACSNKWLCSCAGMRYAGLGMAPHQWF